MRLAWAKPADHPAVAATVPLRNNARARAGGMYAIPVVSGSRLASAVAAGLLVKSVMTVASVLGRSRVF